MSEIATETPKVERTAKVVTLYVCPTPDCPDYYGSTYMPELEKLWTGPKAEDRHQEGISVHEHAPPGMRHTRAECPTCRRGGRYVERVRRSVTILV
jgi:hypothetical protein